MPETSTSLHGSKRRARLYFEDLAEDHCATLVIQIHSVLHGSSGRRVAYDHQTRVLMLVWLPVIIARAMKRFLLVLLMFLLPVLVAWAVAGSYCTHEQSAETPHFGHHFHIHQPQSDDGSQVPLKLHPDCSSCHASTVGMLNGDAQIADVAAPSATCSQPFLLPSSAPPVEPERPKWAARSI